MIPLRSSVRTASNSARWPVVDRDLDVAALHRRGPDDREHAGGHRGELVVGQHDVDDRGAEARLELGRSALGDHPAAVDHRDLVSETISLFQVLRREEERGPGGDEVADDPPELDPTPRIEPCGRLVEEQHMRFVHERGGEVEASAHASRIGAHGTVGGLREAELLEQLRRSWGELSLRLVGEPPHELEVLASGEVFVDRGVLTGEADRLANPFGVAGHVDPEDARSPRVGKKDGREDADGSRLAGAVGPEQSEHGARGYREVDAGQRLDRAELLRDAFDEDGGGGVAHRSKLRGPPTLSGWRSPHSVPSRRPTRRPATVASSSSMLSVESPR